MRSREELLAQLQVYETPYAEEKAFIARFTTLLEHPRAFFRDHLPGHITASAWIVDPARTFTLLTHHAKLNRWLQPGGHADGEQDPLAVALREAREETGLTSLRIVHQNIFDLDIHNIPARKEFPAHDHYDIRFLLEASPGEQFVVTEESLALAWKRVADLPILSGGSSSIMRMAEKVKKLF